MHTRKEKGKEEDGYDKREKRREKRTKGIEEKMKGSVLQYGLNNKDVDIWRGLSGWEMMMPHMGGREGKGMGEDKEKAANGV